MVLSRSSLSDAVIWLHRRHHRRSGSNVVPAVQPSHNSSSLSGATADRAAVRFISALRMMLCLGLFLMQVFVQGAWVIPRIEMSLIAPGAHSRRNLPAR